MGNTRAGGYKARAVGLSFQHFIKALSSYQGFCAIEIPPGCKPVYSNGKMNYKPVKSPFDLVLCKGGRSIHIDCKSLAEGNLKHSQLTDHQVDILYDSEVRGGIISGYLVQFQEHKKIVFFNALKLRALKSGQSLSHNDGINIGWGSETKISSIFGEDHA